MESFDIMDCFSGIFEYFLSNNTSQARQGTILIALFQIEIACHQKIKIRK